MLHDGYLTTGIELRQRCRKSQFKYRYLSVLEIRSKSTLRKYEVFDERLNFIGTGSLLVKFELRLNQIMIRV